MITAGRVLDYALPLARPLPGPSPFPGERRGLLLCLDGAGGARALGECAPLPGFSRESLDDARRELQAFADGYTGLLLPAGLERLDGRFSTWLGQGTGSPSTRFAIETAVLGLLAARRGTGLGHLLTPSPAPTVAVAGLVTEAGRASREARRLVAAGHRTVKLKVGPGDPAAAGAMVAAVRAAMGPRTRLRLDANRAWSVGAARDFLATLETGGATAAVEFVEEPVRDLDGFRALGSPVPLALDEGLQELEPEDLAGFPNLGAVVLKPTLLGLERAAAFARAAHSRGIPAVVSACFESGVGMKDLGQLAAAWGPTDMAAGLDTSRWLAEDLLPLPPARSPATLQTSPRPPAPELLARVSLRCSGA